MAKNVKHEPGAIINSRYDYTSKGKSIAMLIAQNLAQPKENPNSSHIVQSMKDMLNESKCAQSPPGI